jgi:mono/diheme cytochrome c family protein
VDENDGMKGTFHKAGFTDSSCKGGMIMRYAPLGSALLLVMFATHARSHPTVDQTQFPPSYIPSGQEMYHQFCAACHGPDAKGNGPAASRLKTPPPDLTTLAKRNMGKFPREYVASILRFGPGPSAHGSSDMPTWGPVFQIIDKDNERAVQQRIKNISDYLASLQEK